MDGVQEGGLAGGGGLGGGDDSGWIGTLDLGQVACPSLERRSLELVSAVCFLIVCSRECVFFALVSCLEKLSLEARLRFQFFF